MHTWHQLPRVMFILSMGNQYTCGLHTQAELKHVLPQIYRCRYGCYGCTSDDRGQKSATIRALIFCFLVLSAVSAESYTDYIYIYIFIYLCVCTCTDSDTTQTTHIPIHTLFFKDSKCNFTLLVLRKNIFSCEQPLCNTAEQSMMKNILSTIKLWSEKYFKYQFTCDEYTFVTHLIVSYIIHESRKWSR